MLDNPDILCHNDRVDDLGNIVNSLRQHLNELRDNEGTTLPVELIEETVEELTVSLEELQVAEEELRLQNEEIVAAQAVIDSQRQRFEHLFEFAPVAYIITENQGKINQANHIAAELLNVEKSFITGKPLINYIDLKERPVFRKKLEDCIQFINNHPASPEMPNYIKDWQVNLIPRSREPRRVSITISLHRESGKDWLLWALHDITDSWRQQEQIRESEDRFRSLAETTSAAVFVIQQGNIHYANPAAGSLCSRPSTDLIGLPLLELIDPLDRVLLTPLISDTQSAGPLDKVNSLSYHWQVKLPALETNSRWIDLNAQASTLQGKPAWVITAYDISNLVQTREARTQLLHAVFRGQEEERRRISLELHDQVGQELAALNLGLEALKATVSAPESFAHLHQLVNHMHQQIAHLAFDLHPPLLDELGLELAIQNYVGEWSQRNKIQVDFHSSLPARLVPSHEIGTALFRITQEALTNIIKHSHATQVSIILDYRRGQLGLVIEDNGQGFPEEVLQFESHVNTHLGLLNMRERAELVGGFLEIESSPGKGSSIYVRIPLKK